MLNALEVGLLLIGAFLLILLFQHLKEVEKQAEPSPAERENEEEHAPAPVNRLKRYWKD